MRVPGKGRVDASRSLAFTFDGAGLQGFAGDTLASALIGADVKLVGRSFKYHRPRGILTAGSEEPNALMTIGAGDLAVPNRRATMVELTNGLVARSQNAWPSLGFDLLALNDLAAPFLGAGFYYKTFMWPKAFWERVYEPAIRRAAGLGALTGKPSPERGTRAFAHCDLLVIGAGPAGLIAALAAGRAGVDVILADEGSEMGGRLLAETFEVGGKPGHHWVADVLEELASLPNVRLMPRTAVTGAYDQGTYGAYEQGAECFWRIVSPRAVLAAGAIERPVAFANNDRPGIMTAGAVRSYLNRYGVVAGKAVTVFGNNDDAHRTARDLLAAGVHVTALVDSRADAPEVKGVRMVRGGVVCNAGGRQGLSDVRIRTERGEEALATDCLAMSGGWNPSVHLTCHMNGRPDWNADALAFLPKPDAVPGMVVAGAAAGVFSTAGCLRDGLRAAGEALGAPLGMDLPEAEDDPYRIAALWQVPGKGRAWLDFQNDVTIKDVRQAAAESFRSVEHMKRYTTQGMAPDQGKNSNVAALAILADATGRTIPETGTTTFRPPFVPVPIGVLGAGGEGKGFAPERFTTSHADSAARGAPMIEAGLWYRPSYFPVPGEQSWRESCDREVQMVRSKVGVCDVSTLGKIDIQGPDAGRLLDFVYTNRFSGLKVGRVRYGLMLREDGHVMDDGTTARLGQDHFLMTTTTAAAGEVMRHLEFAHQVLNPGWDVAMISVTEQWAQFAVAGPLAKALLGDVVGRSLDDWPFMVCGAVSVLGVPGRLFRISFSGEVGFEIAVPSRFGASLWKLLVERAEALGGGPYGIEALNVLRLEKGFITHAEIHGRTTAYDIGMQGMISPTKDCIGKVMAARPGLVDPGRERLVGLVPVGERRRLLAGAHLFGSDEDAVAANDQGYITSACYSPTLGHDIALAFVKGGPERYGETLRMHDHMRNERTFCVVTRLPFVDKDGGRMRG